MSLSLIIITAASLVTSANTVSTAEPLASPPAGIVHRLTAKDAEAIQEAASRRAIDRVAIDDLHVPDGQIHGEIGFGVGTGGYTSVFGAAIVPLGDNGIAAFSFERTNFGRRHYRY
ncbi:hypothetical protein [Aquisediminimonas profunda]|uniref:hypothetical protein n=1 Tax=Aquisediminimonas profunda TaxID=1550733 RepID=UPI001C631280|nr:hypothetical protein [Aquisediminimonas profunda]